MMAAHSSEDGPGWQGRLVCGLLGAVGGVGACLLALRWSLAPVPDPVTTAVAVGGVLAVGAVLALHWPVLRALPAGSAALRHRVAPLLATAVLSAVAAVPGPAGAAAYLMVVAAVATTLAVRVMAGAAAGEPLVRVVGLAAIGAAHIALGIDEVAGGDLVFGCAVAGFGLAFVAGGVTVFDDGPGWVGVMVTVLGGAAVVTGLVGLLTGALLAGLLLVAFGLWAVPVGLVVCDVDQAAVLARADRLRSWLSRRGRRSPAPSSSDTPTPS